MTDKTTPHPILDHSAKLRAVADRFGFSCPDDQWQTWDTPLRFVCRNGHVLIRTPTLALAFGPRTCKECVGEACARKLRARAEAAGIRWLDQQWVKKNGQLTFECPLGHIWKTKHANIRRNLSCQVCYRKQCSEASLALVEQLRAIAASHGGRYLSRSKRPEHHHFRCAEGHEWEATSSRIKRGAWCFPCGHQRRGKEMLRSDGLSQLHHAAQQRDGVCLDDVYQGMAHRYCFRCDVGHEWRADGNSILSGSWCKECYRDNHNLTLEMAREKARERGGQCLSTEYKNSATPMHWLCDRGHSWHAPFLTIRQGHWCHACAVLSRTWDPKKRARYLAVR